MIRQAGESFQAFRARYFRENPEVSLADAPEGWLWSQYESQSTPQERHTSGLMTEEEAARPPTVIYTDGNRLQLTPAQARDYAAGWRPDPNVGRPYAYGVATGGEELYGDEALDALRTPVKAPQRPVTSRPSPSPSLNTAPETPELVRPSVAPSTAISTAAEPEILEEQTGGRPMALWGALAGALPGIITAIAGGGQQHPTVPPPPQQAPPRPSQWGVNPPFGGKPGMGIRTPFSQVTMFPGRTTAAPTTSANGRRPIFPATGPKPNLPGRWKLNKSGYWRTDPATGQPIYIAPRSIWVPVRRRNPANPRALSSSAERMDMFAGLVGRMEKKGIIERKKPSTRKICFKCGKSANSCRCK